MTLPLSAPRIGVIVLNWNGADDTLACLESLRLAKPTAERVVVVDNASADDSVARIRDWSQRNAMRVDIVVAPENLGFSGGNNLGLELLARDAAITHFLLLNNDATVAGDFFGEMNRALAAAPGAGLLTGTIYEHASPEKVWYAGGREIRYRALIEHFHSPPAGATPEVTEFVSGCVMLISREAMKSVGPLPDCYFPGYMEDAEYSLRTRAAQLPVLYAPRVRAFHKIGATAGPASASPFMTRAQVRHRVFYVRRNFRGVERVVALTYLALTKPGKAVVETLSGRPRMGLAVLRGALEGFVSPCQGISGRSSPSLRSGG
ncbi:MAG: glycosyltransferase family 2 protein [Gemmatimonadota bacterium]|nr:glycosyltransferase family 2 protein [Gemmatimonadota bacterium]